MGLSRFLACIVFTGVLPGQLIPVGLTIPPTAMPPVVFVNGYQSTCTANQFADNFGKFDQLLQATGRVSVFFDNCLYPTKPSIAELGNNLGRFIAGLKYSDGSAVTLVDVVGHSMGGLVIRSYLAGRQTTGSYAPPAAPGIRKAVFLATPHFGTPVASLFGADVQTMELANGSVYTFDLGTWNQGTDDLRGVDALALAGNGGTGILTQAGLDDGVVSTTSASIGFAVAGRTRVVPYCHTPPGAVTVAGFCPANAPGIAQGLNATDANAAAVLSFLNDTAAWQTIGQPPEQNALLSTGGGLVARAKSADDQFLMVSGANAGKTLNVTTSAVAWAEYLPSGSKSLTVNTAAGPQQISYQQPAGYVAALIVKPGPFIARVLPAAAALSPLAIAPGMFVSVYGANFATANAQASVLPLPTSLAGVQVTLNGIPIPLQFVGPGQINAVIPPGVSGLARLKVIASSGTHAVNVVLQPSVPAIFTQDQSGSGPAAALNAITFALVTPSSPLRAGDYVSLYLTGLGAATDPGVTVGGTKCAVSFAGGAPGFPGLDQINCQLASATVADPQAPVIVIAGGRVSNTATLAVQ